MFNVFYPRHGVRLLGFISKEAVFGPEVDRFFEEPRFAPTLACVWCWVPSHSSVTRVNRSPSPRPHHLPPCFSKGQPLDLLHGFYDTTRPLRVCFPHLSPVLRLVRLRRGVLVLYREL